MGLESRTMYRTAGKRALCAVLALAPALVILTVSALAAGPAKGEAKSSEMNSEMNMETFLDRLSMAESGGRAHAKNPLSTALGPYQFIASTWLMIARNELAKEMDGLRPDQVLALRTDPALSRRAAQIYTEQNAAFLVSQGQKATFPNLRLAFLVGPGAALRVLMAGPDRGVAELLGATVIGANPFMTNMTAADLIARAARDIATDPKSVAGVTPDASQVHAAGKTAKPARPRIAVQCDLSLPSCKRWLALAERRMNRLIRRASR
jgi:hypothetical protein